MARVFNIEISEKYGWELDVVDFKGPYNKLKRVSQAPESFAVCVKEENKLVALYDAFCPKTEAIKEANDLDIFLEECNFYDEHNKYSFSGTIIDALIYIQNQYIEYKLPK